MNRVGITGGIGSGKTTVCRLFEVLDIPVYYADSRAKYLMNHDQEVKRSLLQLFGEQAYENGVLNRKYIASIVFHDAAMLEQLNHIVHPAVAVDSELWFSSQSAPYALKEAALLVENESYLELDYLISVSASEDVRVERVMTRDGISSEDVLARMRNQLPQEDKDAVADYVIYNDGRQSLISQVLAVHRSLLER